MSIMSWVGVLSPVENGNPNSTVVAIQLPLWKRDRDNAAAVFADVERAGLFVKRHGCREGQAVGDDQSVDRPESQSATPIRRSRRTAF